MPLPNCENAYIPLPKLTEYLLKERERGDKSRFFTRFGFRREDPEVLKFALLELACTGELVEIEETQHGRKYKVIGLLLCPNRRRPRVMTVWFSVKKREIQVHNCTPKLMNLIQELEEAVLLVDLPAKGLVCGDVGVVVHVYEDHAAYEVEFITKDGSTIAVETLEAAQVRALQPRDLWHVREVSKAA